MYIYIYVYIYIYIICIYTSKYNNDAHFDMGGIKIKNSSNTYKYLGLKFITKKKMFVMDVNENLKCKCRSFIA